jgi:hypothetical protein
MSASYGMVCKLGRVFQSSTEFSLAVYVYLCTLHIVRVCGVIGCLASHHRGDRVSCSTALVLFQLLLARAA